MLNENKYLNLNSMKIVLVRHAKAVDRVEALLQGIHDENRPLTIKGRKKFADFVKQNKKLFEGADILACSEYLRAKQTIEVLITSAFKPSKAPGYIKLPKITPDDSPIHFLDWLKKVNYNYAIVVGHEPFISHFLELVLSKDWDHQKIKKGSVITLQYLQGKFRLISIHHVKD
jgi:phosphohistidine phosphatase SixA